MSKTSVGAQPIDATAPRETATERGQRRSATPSRRYAIPLELRAIVPKEPEARARYVLHLEMALIRARFAQLEKLARAAVEQWRLTPADHGDATMYPLASFLDALPREDGGEPPSGAMAPQNGSGKACDHVARR